MVAREASRLPSAARAPLQSEQIKVPDLRDCLLGDIGVPEVHRVVLQSLLGCSLCRSLQLRRGLESLGCLGLRGPQRRSSEWPPCLRGPQMGKSPTQHKEYFGLLSRHFQRANGFESRKEEEEQERAAEKYYYCTTVITTVLLILITTVLLLYYYCTTTVLLLYYYCTTVLLYYCTTVLLYYCTTVLLYYCTTTVPLLYHYCTTTVLLLYYCTTVLLTVLLLKAPAPKQLRPRPPQTTKDDQGGGPPVTIAGGLVV